MTETLNAKPTLSVSGNIDQLSLPGDNKTTTVELSVNLDKEQIAKLEAFVEAHEHCNIVVTLDAYLQPNR